MYLEIIKKTEFLLENEAKDELANIVYYDAGVKRSQLTLVTF